MLIPSRLPSLPSALLAGVIATGSLLAVAPDADARGFGSKKARFGVSATSKARKAKPARRGLFTPKRQARNATSAAGTRDAKPTRTRRQHVAPAGEALSHPVAATTKRRGLLARVFGGGGREAAARPATHRPLRRLDGSSSAFRLAPGQPNAVQSAPKINHGLISRGSKSSRRVVVNIAKQRAYLYVDGKVAVDTPVSTARRGKYTPRGSFRVGERVAQGKVSTIYNVSMPYWMRLGSSPYGMHAGYLPGYPASAGCIRMPYEAAQAVYKATAHGTNVRIVGG